MEPSAPTPTRRAIHPWPLVLAALVLLPGALRAQDGDVRIGVTLGGTGFLGLSVEFLNEARTAALDVTVGTWSFRDVSLSVVGKGRFGASHFRPVAGAGLWAVFSFPPRGEGGDARQNGVALLARAPFGFDWDLGSRHFLTGELSLNRALWIRRTRPGDDVPVGRRIVPFPGVAYRWIPTG